MTPERWRRITELFFAALDQSPSEVNEFIRREAGNDAEIYSEVRRMLDQHAESGFLDRPPLIPVLDAASPVFQDGQMVANRYCIVRFINRGGMGEVYEAQDQDLNEHVALKTLLPAIASDDRMIFRFKQEIQLSRKISHPNVCNVYDLARHPADSSAPDTTYFLTMELLAGETLAARLHREVRIPWDAALPLLQQMANALEAAHRAGVIHRDFKPSNVMLVSTTDGIRAVVTDFGLARSFSPSGESTATITGNVMGTFDYMAPELFSGRPASTASDLYALGLVAYKMLTGVLPAEAPPLDSKGALGPQLRAIGRALEPDPAKRYDRPSQLIQALHGEPVGPGGIRPHQPRSRLTRRIVLGTCAAGSLLACFYELLRLRDQGPLIAADKRTPLLMLTPFTNSVDSPEAAARALALSLLIEKQLGQSGRIRLLSRERITHGWKSNPDNKGNMPAVLPPRAAREIAVREKSDCVLFCSFSQVAEEWTLRARLELMGDNPEHPLQWRSRDFRDQDAPSAAFEAVNWIRKMLAESADEVQTRTRRPEDLTTNNWHALQEYALGDDAWRRNDRPAAIEHLREALLIDPEFALAAARLADLSTASGRIDEGLQYYERAEKLLVARNLTDRESLQIRGIFAFDTGRYDEADHVFALWGHNYPQDVLPLYYRSTTLDRLGQHEQAGPLLETAIQHEPASYAFAFRRAHRALLYGSQDEARIRLDEVARLLNRDYTDQLRAAMAFGDSRLPEVWTHLERMRTNGTISFQSKALVYQACFRVEQGRLEDAATLLELGIEFDRENGLPRDEQFAKQRRLAQVRLTMGQRAVALEKCRAIVDAEPGLETTLRTACVMARAGDIRTAQSLLPKTEPKWPFQRHWFQRLRAEIALARGNPREALEYTRGAPPSRSEVEWPLYLALAARAAGEVTLVFQLLNSLFSNPAKFWYYADATEPGFVRSALDLAVVTGFRAGSNATGPMDALATYFTRR